MKINSVEVFLLEAGYLASRLFQRKQASPMNIFPEFAANRSLWMWPPEKVVTLVRSDDLTGISVTNGGAVVATIVRDQFGRLLLGRDASDCDTAWDIMVRSVSPFDNSGFAMMAVSAIDIALWDLRSKSSSKHLCELLGGDGSARSLRAYATTSDPDAFSGSHFSGIK